MVLPELSWQFVYARLAWALVLATLVLGAWPAQWRLPRRVLGGAVIGCLVLMALPGEASGAWHLGLAFQYPSALLVGLCCVRLHARWHGATGARTGAAMPLPLAASLALGGALLYLDAFGLLSRGYYHAGFGPGLASLVAVLLAVACAAGIVRGRSRPQACALLAAVLLFSLARLPTGNLWDALLDPLLWGWALASTGAAALRALLRRRARAQPTQPEPGLQELPVLRAEPFSPIKE